MGFFSETVSAYLAGYKVQAAALVMFDFTSGPMRLWRGHGNLTTADANVWQGLGELGSVTGIEQAVNGQAPQMVFTLSGLDAAIMHLARDEFEAEAIGRSVYVFIQFFGVDDVADPDNQRPLDLPYPIAAGRMMRPTFNFPLRAENQSSARSISISAESLFSLRSRPKWAMYTDSDQQQRFPGDLGFEFVGGLVNKTVTWPDY